MKRLMKWTGGILLGLTVLAGTAHASTSVAAHEDGGCVACNFFECLHAAVYDAFHHS